MQCPAQGNEYGTCRDLHVDARCHGSTCSAVMHLLCVCSVYLTSLHCMHSAFKTDMMASSSCHSDMPVSRVEYGRICDLPSLDADRLHADSLHADSLHADSLHADSLHADSLHADSLHADSLHADSLHADSLHADSLQDSPKSDGDTPDYQPPLFPAFLTSPVYIPSFMLYTVSAFPACRVARHWPHVILILVGAVTLHLCAVMGSMIVAV